MKRVKQLKGWGIYENNEKEKQEYGFDFTVIQPDLMDCGYSFTPSDTDMELCSLDEAVSWIKNY